MVNTLLSMVHAWLPGLSRGMGNSCNQTVLVLVVFLGFALFCSKLQRGEAV